MRIVNFAAEGTGVPLAAEPVFTIGNFAITNSMLLGALVVVIISTLFIVAAIKSRIKPVSKFAYFMENVTEFVLDTLTSNFGGDEKKARKFLPLFLGLFVFILVNNLFGLLPGMGGSVYIESNGIQGALLRPFTTDLNGTVALALISIGTVQYFAIKQRGLFGHVKHYFTIMTPWWNPMNFFLGPLEILSELIRILTLSLRLFGVIYAGEVLLHVVADLSGNFAWAGVVPVILMEIFFSTIQAYLFIMLTSVYLEMATAHEEAHHDQSHSPSVNQLKHGEAVTSN